MDLCESNQVRITPQITPNLELKFLRYVIACNANRQVTVSSVVLPRGQQFKVEREENGAYVTDLEGFGTLVNEIRLRVGGKALLKHADRVSIKVRACRGARTSFIPPIFAQHTSLMEHLVHTEQIVHCTSYPARENQPEQSRAKLPTQAGYFSARVNKGMRPPRVKRLLRCMNPDRTLVSFRHVNVKMIVIPVLYIHLRFFIFLASGAPDPFPFVREIKERYALASFLGRGSFGDVILAFDKVT
uniref:FHA domain-containing protein n=1 Tax=Timema douglasi TaxID=61478 RepID=A0A7R8ZBP2_TIMDO|nr:unnamed protein product [Timema douglasi]